MKKVLFILGELSDKDIEWMLAAGKREQVPQDAVLIHEGQPVAALYIVLEGLLGVCVEATGSQVIAQLGSGEIVGEMSFVDARPPSATVKALENSAVLSIPRAHITAKLQREPDFAARFYRALATFLSARLREMDRQLARSRGQPDQDDADELDPNVLDTVHLAGSRFDHMLKRLMSG
jgi:bacteriocin-type transport-associated protein